MVKTRIKKIEYKQIYFFIGYFFPFFLSNFYYFKKNYDTDNKIVKRHFRERFQEEIGKHKQKAYIEMGHKS